MNIFHATYVSSLLLLSSSQKILYPSICTCKAMVASPIERCTHRPRSLDRVIPDVEHGSQGSIDRCSVSKSLKTKNYNLNEDSTLAYSFGPTGSSEAIVQRTRLSSRISRACFMSATVASLGAVSAMTIHPVRSWAYDDTGSSGTSAGTQDVGKNGDATGTFMESISGFVAGATLSATKTIVKYPLDTATVRLQMPSSEFSISRLGPLFEGSFNGITSPLISNVPAGAIFFAVKDAAKEALKGGNMAKWISTSFAVAAALPPYWLVRNPSEVVKTRQQVGVAGYGEGTSAIDAFRAILRDESFAGLYTGYVENILYAYPADVIKFILYEALSGGKKGVSPATAAVYGAASTAVAQFMTTPLDVVRNRIMARGGGVKNDGETDAKINLCDESYFVRITKLAKEEGPEGLFAGASPRVGKALLSGAIQFATYEETKQKIALWFGKRK